MGTLFGKVVLVTGGSKGIGAGIAKSVGIAGATVLVNYASDREGAKRTVEAIAKAGGKAEDLQGDLSRPEDVSKVFRTIGSEHGKLDVLVNNAGVAGFGSLEQVTTEEFHRIFDLNVLGVILSSQAAVKLMATGGSIINIGSLAGTMPAPYGTIYSASKAAVNNITITLSKELGPKQIRVNAVNPGLTITEGLKRSGFMEGERYAAAIKATPLGRAGLPEDIGKIVAFLASDEAGWITGQLINASGGTTL